MTTTDTNLQIVNSMTQEKLNELKNSDGKIPSLANQLVMTDDYGVDESLEYTRTEVVYDMTSSDASKNWGYPNGIQGNVSVTKDLTKYNFLDFVVEIYNNSSINTGGWSGVYRMDLTSKKTTDDWNVASFASAYSDATQTGYFSKSPWLFVFLYNKSTKILQWRISINGESHNNSNLTFISKIYGVLKTPAIIYTGEQLFAGNGITISNGTIGITPAQSVATNTTRTEQNDAVVEYYMSSDGNTWYRKWASGWKECGLHVVKTMTPPANGANSGFGVITLPVTFSNKLYQTQITNEWKVAYGNKFFFSAERSSDASTNNSISVAVTTCTNSSLPSSMQIACNIYCCGF